VLHRRGAADEAPIVEEGIEGVRLMPEGEWIAISCRDARGPHLQRGARNPEPACRSGSPTLA